MYYMSDKIIISELTQANIFKNITNQLNVCYNKSDNYNGKLMASEMLQNVSPW